MSITPQLIERVYEIINNKFLFSNDKDDCKFVCNTFDVPIHIYLQDHKFKDMDVKERVIFLQISNTRNCSDSVIDSAIMLSTSIIHDRIFTIKNAVIKIDSIDSGNCSIMIAYKDKRIQLKINENGYYNLSVMKLREYYYYKNDLTFFDDGNTQLDMKNIERVNLNKYKYSDEDKQMIIAELQKKSVIIKKGVRNGIMLNFVKLANKIIKNKISDFDISEELFYEEISDDSMLELPFTFA